MRDADIRKAIVMMAVLLVTAHSSSYPVECARS
jgi:hypothetical protein